MIKSHRAGAYLFKATAYTWLGIAAVLAIVANVAAALGYQEGGPILAGIALCALLGFVICLIISNQLADTADMLEEAARRIGHPFYPAAPRSTRHQWNRKT
jgi:hypothetical protein